MLRNLCKGKYRLFFPIRFWVKKIGPGSSKKMAMERKRKTGESKIKAKAERMVSPPLLITLV